MESPSGKTILSGYLFRALNSAGPLLQPADKTHSLFTEAPFPDITDQDCSLEKGIVYGGPGTKGLSTIVGTHLQGYFAHRWSEFQGIKLQTQIEAARASLQKAATKLDTVTTKAKPGAPSILRCERELLRCERELKVVADKATIMTKIFAVIDVAHVRALGFAVVQDDRGYPGHAIIRPATQMAAAVYGTAMLQIPFFVREIRNTRGCETLELVSCQDRLPVFAAVFSNITTEYVWSKIEAPGGQQYQAYVPRPCPSSS
jgi:hypothetical protein